MDNIFVEKDNLLATAARLVMEGGRVASATCKDVLDHFEVIYHFQKGQDTTNVRVKVGKDEEIPSLSGVTITAALMENEMREFFGLKVVGLAIDFKGRMLLASDSPQAPLLKS